MKPARLVLVVLGSLVALLGFGLIAGGAALGWGLATQRDSAGFFTTPDVRLQTDSYALTSDQIDLADTGPDRGWAHRDLATVRIVADNAETGALFVGIGPETAVEGYLAGVRHDKIVELRYRPFTVDYRRENADGTSAPASPADQTIWVAKASGETTQTLTWDLEPGRWAIVVMNADGHAGIAADISIGGRVNLLVPLAIGLAIGGLLLVGVGAVVIVGTVAAPRTSGQDTSGAVPPRAGPGEPPYSSPVRVEGHLDPALSRWRWLVKWLLVIPHAIVLALLWVAFAVLTFVAFFSILFTGRYPRSFFEFNVGVLRWTWRVGFYAMSALATDRYPPFTLAPTDYPASLEVAYPERLSRGLVLVKSWLLAIPHLVIVSLLAANWTISSRNNGQLVLSGGLLGLLVLVAGIALLVNGRYPQGLFDLVMGINRWVYRVLAYVALMTDQYPPFHLDQGGLEPLPAPPPQLTQPPPPPLTPPPPPQPSPLPTPTPPPLSAPVPREAAVTPEDRPPDA